MAKYDKDAALEDVKRIREEARSEVVAISFPEAAEALDPTTFSSVVNRVSYVFEAALWAEAPALAEHRIPVGEYAGVQRIGSRLDTIYAPQIIGIRYGSALQLLVELATSVEAGVVANLISSYFTTPALGAQPIIVRPPTQGLKAKAVALTGLTLEERMASKRAGVARANADEQIAKGATRIARRIGKDAVEPLGHEGDEVSADRAERRALSEVSILQALSDLTKSLDR